MKQPLLHLRRNKVQIPTAEPQGNHGSAVLVFCPAVYYNRYK